MQLSWFVFDVEFVQMCACDMMCVIVNSIVHHTLYYSIYTQCRINNVAVVANATGLGPQVGLRK